MAIDNNPAERAIKPVVIGRKNWLFAGADAGGETLAEAMTIIESAKLSGLDPEGYLADILARIPFTERIRLRRSLDSLQSGAVALSSAVSMQPEASVSMRSKPSTYDSANPLPHSWARTGSAQA